jgi:hypothetical protein
MNDRVIIVRDFMRFFKYISALMSFLFLVLLFQSADAIAQIPIGRMRDRDRMPEENSLVYFEPLNFIGDSAGLSRVDIQYQIGRAHV